MTTKASEVFSAFRQASITELQHNILNDLLPNYTAEAEDIRREHEANTPISAALADHKKHARVLDLIHRRNKFIAECNSVLVDTLTKKAKELNGTITEVTETHRDTGKEQTVLKVLFDDGSRAKMPRGLWIDFKQFVRV